MFQTIKTKTKKQKKFKRDQFDKLNPGDHSK